MGLIFSQCDAKRRDVYNFSITLYKEAVWLPFYFLLPTAWEGVATRAPVLDLDIGAMCRAWKKTDYQPCVAHLCIVICEADKLLSDLNHHIFWFLYYNSLGYNLCVDQRLPSINSDTPPIKRWGVGLHPFPLNVRRSVTVFAKCWAQALRNWTRPLSVFRNTLFGIPEPSCKKSDSLIPPCWRGYVWTFQWTVPAFQTPFQGSRHINDAILDPLD